MTFPRELRFEHQLIHVTGSSVSPVEVAITVAQIIDEQVNADQVRREVQRLSNLVISPNVDDVVNALKSEGFTGQKRVEKAIYNNRIDLALQYKAANPITLAMILIGVGRNLDVDCFGINFPQHFLASVDGHMVDPLQMDVVSEEELTSWAKKNGLQVDNMFDRATNRDIAIRMLNNVSLAIDVEYHPWDALRMLDYKEMLLPDNSTEILIERAGIWVEIGDFGMARELLVDALETESPESLKKQVRRRIRRLSIEGDPVLH